MKQKKKKDYWIEFIQWGDEQIKTHPPKCLSFAEAMNKSYEYYLKHKKQKTRDLTN